MCLFTSLLIRSLPSKCYVIQWNLKSKMMTKHRILGVPCCGTNPGSSPEKNQGSTTNTACGPVLSGDRISTRAVYRLKQPLQAIKRNGARWKPRILGWTIIFGVKFRNFLPSRIVAEATGIFEARSNGPNHSPSLDDCWWLQKILIARRKFTRKTCIAIWWKLRWKKMNYLPANPLPPWWTPPEPWLSTESIHSEPRRGHS